MLKSEVQTETSHILKNSNKNHKLPGKSGALINNSTSPYMHYVI
jgi:hypothetical protein